MEFSREPGLSLTVVLDGAGQERLRHRDGAGSSLPCKSGTTTLRFARRELAGRWHISPGARLLAVEVLLSLCFLDRLGDEAPSLGSCHPLCCLDVPELWAGAMPTPETMGSIATQIALRGTAGGGEELLLLAYGALELATAGLSALRRPPDICCCDRDHARLREARRMLDSCPGHAWCIRELARKVGLNERKLKSGFRAQFGTTVNECLTRARLRMAHQLLLENRAAVGEVSRRVGYANPRHFTQLFRDRYGVNPSVLLRQG
ncbi:helix-turn-helix transcriptional regulator [Siccirubricoccus phaeus]|uniref:helix-turn-helix transcriptional regulator n=1 Tax=Siccirubricoccus phaeus TaxID=2595053 RepID=UPI00165A51FF|nr:AraC family transcriptional regulator [Siccirubricoccus phaeus]